VTQTSDGYLWLLGAFAMTRFDGVRFTPVFPDSLSRRRWSVAEREKVRLRFAFGRGRLFVIENGDVVSYDTGVFTRRPLTEPQYDPTHPPVIEDPVATPDGTVWGRFNNEEIRSIRDGVLRRPNIAALASGRVQLFGVDSKGAVYVSIRGGRIFRILNEHATELAALPEARGEAVQRFVATDSVIWLQYRFAVARWTPAGTSVVFKAPDGSLIWNVVDDRRGGVWISTDRAGLWHLDARGRVAESIAASQMAGTLLEGLCLDSESSLWVVTDQGLQQFRRTPFQTASFGGRLASVRFRHVAWDANRTFWAGSENDSVAQVSLGGAPNAVDLFVRSAVMASGTVAGRASIEVLPNGAAWAGTRGNPATLVRWSPSGAREASMKANMPAIDDLRSMRDGSVWGLGQQGLFRVVGNAAIPFVPSNVSRIRFAKAWGSGTLFEDSKGRLLVGSAVLWRIEGDSVVELLQPTEIPSRPVWNMFEDHDGTIWAGVGTFGLLRIRDRTVTRVPFGPDWEGTVRGIGEDADHHLWLSTTVGVIRTTAERLDSIAEGRRSSLGERVFTIEDGLPSFDAPPGRNTVHRDSAGVMWFAFEHALAFIDPSAIAQNDVVPPVSIEGIEVDDRTLSPAALNAGIPPQSYRIVVRFSAGSLSFPERVRFRYRLEGADPAWTVVAGKERTATYTSLSPKKYTFHVQAANDDGVWNNVGATLSFSVLPAWYQTRFALALGVLMFGISVSGATWTVARQRQSRREARLRVAIEERARIARELHDTLLQGFTGITLKLQAIKDTIIGSPREASASLDLLLEAADATLSSARRAVWNLRPPDLDHVSLAEGLNVALKRATHGALRLEYRVEGRARTLPTATATTLFQIALEAAANAVKHADATTLTVELTYRDSDVSVRVADDGCGFDIDEPRSSSHQGLGLTGMRERAGMAGIDIELRSTIGVGSEVLIVAPK
jgi:signal transduction histidine kinase/ligand-binding sensor domain-containing protein